jgi:hypothetical protein
MLVSLLAFIILPFDYYFGFTAIATEWFIIKIDIIIK